MARSKSRKLEGSGRQTRSADTAPSILLPLVCLLIAGVVVYANSLSNPFVFDDHDTIENNVYIRSAGTMFETEKGSALTGRPVVAASFALNHAVFGNDASAYRAVNLGIHILCAMVLFLLARSTLRRTPLGADDARTASWLGLAVALLWLVHPIGSEAVNYLTQRTESLMALSFVLTLYFSSQVPGSTAHHVASVACCGLGMLCKETMAVAPIVVVLYDRAFVFGSFGAAFRARRRFYAALAATWIILAIIVATQSREFSGGYASATVSVWTYLLNQAAIITHYLRLVVWPDALVAFYGWARPIEIGEVWMQGSVVIALVLISLWLLVSRPKAGFLAASFFIVLAPTSSLIPIAAEVGADRRMYLPLMAAVGIGVAAVVYGVRRFAPARVAAVTIGLVLVAGGLLSARTIARNREYASELALSTSVLQRWPSGIGHHMVGLSLAKLGRHEEAIPELAAAVSEYPPARYDLGTELFRTGKLDEALAQLEQFVRDEPNLFASSAARTLMGRIHAARGRSAEAIAEFRRAAGGQVPDPAANGPLADLLLDQKAYDEAIAAYRAYLQAFPAHTAAMAGLGIAQASSGRSADAIATFRRVVDLEPRNAAARENLAMALLDTGQADAAVIEAQQAAALSPANPAAFDLLGQALVSVKRLDDAKRAFERALQLDPGYAPARQHLARIGKGP